MLLLLLLGRGDVCRISSTEFVVVINRCSPCLLGNTRNYSIAIPAEDPRR